MEFRRYRVPAEQY